MEKAIEVGSVVVGTGIQCVGLVKALYPARKEHTSYYQGHTIAEVAWDNGTVGEWSTQFLQLDAWTF